VKDNVVRDITATEIKKIFLPVFIHYFSCSECFFSKRKKVTFNSKIKIIKTKKSSIRSFKKPGLAFYYFLDLAK